MAEKYWMTFRIKKVGDYDERYKRLTAGLFLIAEQRHWKEPTSFYAFTSSSTIDEVAAHIKSLIDESSGDLALIGRIGFKSYRLIGGEDDDVFSFFPELQRS